MKPDPSPSISDLWTNRCLFYKTHQTNINKILLDSKRFVSVERGIEVDIPQTKATQLAYE